ncbi:MAG: hypothetical protein ABIH83_03790 [Candidatus Micrarchaeota archaeon]
MGFIESIVDKISKESDSEKGGSSRAVPFTLSTSFRPVRLRARSENSCELVINLKNISNSDHICSVVVEIPKSLGFDQMGLHKTKELRLGNLEAGKGRTLSVNISANNQTPSGTYRIFTTANSHYRDYTHLLNSVRKSVELRVV